ncbi:MAG: signal peptidase II [Oscillospiraceae bacterium]|nr:signal peptidase II [Oscillospiraceae bacterium]
MATNLLCVAVLVAADRLFKIAAAAYLTDGGVVLIPGILGLRLLEGGNTGAAFGLFSDSTEILAWISAVCSAVLLIMLIINRFSSEAERWGFVLICAGAMGNLYDRAFCGSVTDYLEFLFCEFPIFNFADVLVDIGCLLVFICVFFFPERKRISETASAESGDSEETEDDED